MCSSPCLRVCSLAATSSSLRPASERKSQTKTQYACGGSAIPTFYATSSRLIRFLAVFRSVDERAARAAERKRIYAALLGYVAKVGSRFHLLPPPTRCLESLC